MLKSDLRLFTSPGTTSSTGWLGVVWTSAGLTHLCLSKSPLIVVRTHTNPVSQTAVRSVPYTCVEMQVSPSSWGYGGKILIEYHSVYLYIPLSFLLSVFFNRHFCSYETNRFSLVFLYTPLPFLFSVFKKERNVAGMKLIDCHSVFLYGPLSFLFSLLFFFKCCSYETNRLSLLYPTFFPVLIIKKMFVHKLPPLAGYSLENEKPCVVVYHSLLYPRQSVWHIRLQRASVVIHPTVCVDQCVATSFKAFLSVNRTHDCSGMLRLGAALTTKWFTATHYKTKQGWTLFLYIIN